MVYFYNILQIESKVLFHPSVWVQFDITVKECSYIIFVPPFSLELSRNLFFPKQLVAIPDKSVLFITTARELLRC